ncbi:hypothetical protein AA313_de0201431 [Arthrobotrys entomopaga]|nr:hypothetical protein AA313_de0201431 [Arthrobotrys entomopaga]
MDYDLQAEGDGIPRPILGKEQLDYIEKYYPELKEAFEEIEKDPPSRRDFLPPPTRAPPGHDSEIKGPIRITYPILSKAAEKVIRIVLKSLRDHKDPVFQRAYDLLDDVLKKKLDQFLAGGSIDDLFDSSEGFTPPASQAVTEKFLQLDQGVKDSADSARETKAIAAVGVLAAENGKFSNWGETVKNTPGTTWAAPKTVSELCNIVQQAKHSGQRVRVSGYRHSWSDIFSENGQVLVSILDEHLVETLPNCTSLEATPDYTGNDFKIIDLKVNPENPKKALVKVGAAVTNEDFRRWAVKNNAWTLPINVIMVE